MDVLRRLDGAECAGRIHTDFQRGFIKAEVVQWDELLGIGSWTKAKELGKIRSKARTTSPRTATSWSSASTSDRSAAASAQRAAHLGADATTAMSWLVGRRCAPVRRHRSCAVGDDLPGIDATGVQTGRSAAAHHVPSALSGASERSARGSGRAAERGADHHRPPARPARPSHNASQPQRLPSTRRAPGPAASARWRAPARRPHDAGRGVLRPRRCGGRARWTVTSKAAQPDRTTTASRRTTATSGRATRATALATSLPIGGDACRREPGAGPARRCARAPSGPAPTAVSAAPIATATLDTRRPIGPADGGDHGAQTSPQTGHELGHDGRARPPTPRRTAPAARRGPWPAHQVPARPARPASRPARSMGAVLHARRRSVARQRVGAPSRRTCRRARSSSARLQERTTQLGVRCAVTDRRVGDRVRQRRRAPSTARSRTPPRPARRDSAPGEERGDLHQRRVGHLIDLHPAPRVRGRRHAATHRSWAPTSVGRAPGRSVRSGTPIADDRAQTRRTARRPRHGARTSAAAGSPLDAER